MGSSYQGPLDHSRNRVEPSGASEFFKIIQEGDYVFRSFAGQQIQIFAPYRA